MNKYNCLFMDNGRIIFYKSEDFYNAVEQEKELLIIGTGWAGGYAQILGATKESDPYNKEGKECLMCYQTNVMDKEFSVEELNRFYKIIISQGERVYMMTGDQANQHSQGKFHDWHSTYEDYLNKIYKNPVSKEEYERFRHLVDVDKTIHMIQGEDVEEKIKALSGYVPFYKNK